MEHITGTPRQQITFFPDALDDYIREDNPVRFLDAFVDGLDTQKLRFEHATVSSTGRPPYHPKDLLKLYLYGYLNRIRSSRRLEAESGRNLEVLWLLKRLSPDHKTISDFRRENPEPLRDVFKQFVQTCRELALFGKELVAIDSTKFKAHNSRDRVQSKKQLDDSIDRINKSIGRYLHQLDENDTKEGHTAPTPTKEQLQEKIATLRGQKAQLDEARTQLNNSGEKYISLTDPDCRLIWGRKGIDPGYKMHAAVDSKHSLIVDYKLTNNSPDSHQLSPVALSTKTALGVHELTVCADTGYYDAIDLKTCEDHQIEAYVSPCLPKAPKRTEVPKPGYFHDDFLYDDRSDTYQCPAGHLLQYYQTRSKEDGRRRRIYRTNACNQCAVRRMCTASPRGRYVYRWEHEAVLDRLKQRLKNRPEITRNRKKIIEHVFGTQKTAWDYGAFLLRGLQNVSAEAALMNLAYNIKRALTILGTKKLVAHLQSG